MHTSAAHLVVELLQQQVDDIKGRVILDSLSRQQEAPHCQNGALQLLGHLEALLQVAMSHRVQALPSVPA